MVSQPSNDPKKKKRQKTQTTSKSSLPIISASDIERYGYCPMSWWLKYEGITVSDEALDKGTEEHKKLIKKVSRVRESEGKSKRSEFNIKLFAFIAIILGINAIVILYPNPFLKDFLVYMGLTWLLLAMIYYFYSIFKGEFINTNIFIQTVRKSITDNFDKQPIEKPQKKRTIFKSNPQTWKQSAIYFIIIAGGLAFNGLSLLQPAPPEIMSRIYIVSALLWLIGTGAVLYFVLRAEANIRDLDKSEIQKVNDISLYSLTKSEKLIIAFAIVATLLAINGLTIQYRDTFAQFMILSQIIIGLAGLWLGVSFVFIYLSIRGSVVIRTFAKDFMEAPTESKKYKMIMEKIASPSISHQVLSYNWPLLFTIVAIILGINSILLMYGSEVLGNQEDILSRFLIIIALLWLLGAFIFLYDVVKNTELSKELRRLHGIYKGKIEYTDKLDNKSKMLFSNRFCLRGKPDYIVKIKGKYVPVEVKTGKIPKGPHFSHIIQIAAYCLLINEKYKIRPPYGIISYSKDVKHKIDYDENLENLLIEKLDEMRTCIIKGEAHRNHHRIGKCRYCSRRESCSEKLE